HFDLPPSLQVMQIYLIPFNTTNCTLGTEIAEYNLEGDGTGVVFAITGIGSATSLPPVSPKTTIPTTVLTPVTSTTQSAPLPNTISVSTNIAPKFNFMRDLYLGMVGDDVRMLQVWLNTHGYVLASSGAGSPGNETSYFGKLTQTALAKFQLATGISPTAGYFGPKTRGAISTR
ncbi:MAG: peptidoglycan-binding domain-containing protein, partial [bacterium]|nr:peptidoglycan-binding domain-containing protein [bacterium]